MSRPALTPAELSEREAVVSLSSRSGVRGGCLPSLTLVVRCVVSEETNEMNEDGSITLTAAEAKQLYGQYLIMLDDVYNLASVCLASMMLAQAKPEKLDELTKRCEGLHDKIASRLSAFNHVLRSALQQGTEPGAAPNGGPAKPHGDSGATGGPPSVS